MIGLKPLAAKALMIAEANSAEILTGFGLAGVVLTGVTSGRARLKADDILMQVEADIENNAAINNTEVYQLTFQDKFKLTWWCYALPVGIGVATIGCILGSHHIQGKKLAALAGAYTITDSMFKEYKEKIREKLGDKKIDEAEHAINQDKMSQFTSVDSDIFATNHGDVLCYDVWSGMKFYSNAEAIRQAVHQVNAMMLDDVYIDLNAFYQELGLDGTVEGDETGWNALVDKSIRVKLDSCLDKEKIPCLTLELIPHPSPLYKEI